ADAGWGGNLVWTRLGPANPPLPARTKAGMAWYTAAQGAQLIVSGGAGAGGLLGDSWLFSLTNNQWTAVAAPLPSPRSGTAVAFDPSIAVTQLGGFAGTAVRTEMWDFNFNALLWHPRLTADRPIALGGLAVYDRANHRVLKFGG